MGQDFEVFVSVGPMFCRKEYAEFELLVIDITPGSRQSLTLHVSTIDERGSKIDRNSVFDCHVSPVWRQMAIENTVSIDFRSTFLDSIGVLDCRQPGVDMEIKERQNKINSFENMKYILVAKSCLEFIVTPVRKGDSELPKEIYPLTRQKLFDHKQL